MLGKIKFSAFKFSFLAVSIAHASVGVIFSTNDGGKGTGIRQNLLKVSFSHSKGSSEFSSGVSAKKTSKKRTHVKASTTETETTMSDDEGAGETNQAETSGGDKTYDSQHVSVLAKPLNTVKPVYPDEAIRKGIETFVKVQIIVDENGIPVDVHSEPSEYGFANAAEEAAKDLRFSPARLNDIPVRVKILWVFHFRLNEE